MVILSSKRRLTQILTKTIYGDYTNLEQFVWLSEEEVRMVTVVM